MYITIVSKHQSVFPVTRIELNMLHDDSTDKKMVSRAATVEICWLVGCGVCHNYELIK
jgi:hypothetical protein